MIYQVGPLEIETGKHPKIKTFLSATEDEIREHGFDSDFFYNENDVSSLIKDGKLADNPPYFTMYQDGEYDTDFAYDLEKKKINLTVRSAVLNTNFEHAWEDVDYYPIYSFFHFNREAGDLTRTLSDVEDVAKMVEPIKIKKGVPNLSQINVDVTKDQENPFEKDTYHVHFIGETPYWEKNAIQTDLVKLDIHANNMKEFLSQLQKAELSYINEQSKHWEEEHTVEPNSPTPYVPYEKFIQTNYKESTTTEIDFTHKDNDLPFREDSDYRGR